MNRRRPRSAYARPSQPPPRPGMPPKGGPGSRRRPATASRFRSAGRAGGGRAGAVASGAAAGAAATSRRPMSASGAGRASRPQSARRTNRYGGGNSHASSRANSRLDHVPAVSATFGARHGGRAARRVYDGDAGLSRPASSSSSSSSSSRRDHVARPSLDLLLKLRSFGLEDVYPNPATATAPRARNDSTAWESPRPRPASRGAARTSTAAVAATASTSASSPVVPPATVHELQEGLQSWLHEADHNSFKSFAVYCEYKLKRGVSLSEQFACPNRFGLAVAWACLVRAADSMPNYRGLLESLAQGLGSAIFCDFEALSGRLVGDGGEDDAWNIFDADTHFARSLRQTRELDALRTAVGKLLSATQRLKDDLARRAMFSALGVVSDAMQAEVAAAAQMISPTAAAARDYGGDLPPRPYSAQGISGPESAGGGRGRSVRFGSIREEEEDEEGRAGPTIATRASANVPLEAAMRTIMRLDVNTIRSLVDDLVSHREGCASAELLGDIFGIAAPENRHAFLGLLWRLLTHAEKGAFLDTVPMRSRDGNIREMLEDIILESGMRVATAAVASDGDGDAKSGGAGSHRGGASEGDQKQQHGPLSDQTIVAMVDQACHAAGLTDTAGGHEFLFRMMCALEMVNVGKQTVDSETVEMPRDPQSAIESRAREIVRLRHVALEEIDRLRDELESSRDELADAQASMRSMAKVQASLSEYGKSSEIRSDGPSLSASGGGGAGGGDPVGSPSMAEKGPPRTHATEWPIFHHAPSARKHSMRRLIDRFFEEETLRTGSSSPRGTGSSGVPLSLEEVHESIACFYSSAVLYGSQGSYPMSQIMYLELVREYGDPHQAVAHCERLDSALREFHKVDLRCHLFGMLCGSLDPCSFINRPEATKFVATALAHIINLGVMDGISRVEDLFATGSMVAAANEEEGAEEAFPKMQQERAERVVRDLFCVSNGEGTAVSAPATFVFLSRSPPPPRQ